MADLKAALTGVGGALTGAVPAGAAELPWYAVLLVASMSSLVAYLVTGLGIGLRDGLAVGVRAVILRALDVPDPSYAGDGRTNEPQEPAPGESAP